MADLLQGVGVVDHVGAEAWEAVQDQAGRGGEISSERGSAVMNYYDIMAKMKMMPGVLSISAVVPVQRV